MTVLHYFYPRSPCGERRGSRGRRYSPASISIHALLAESDVPPSLADSQPEEFLSTLSLRRATHSSTPSASRRQNFYPRSPCGERLITRTGLVGAAEFLSTLSLRRATISCALSASKLGDFYPRSPCGERRISSIINNVIDNFYPRSPCGERRVTVLGIQHKVGISIHALLAESDCYSLRHSAQGWHFYPRSPCGERRGGHISKARSEHFYPRSPCGERPPPYNLMIQHKNFYPRSPCGERQLQYAVPEKAAQFLSTLSLRRATPLGRLISRAIHHFYPRSPCGERRQKYINGRANYIISIHALLAESD